MQPIIIICFLCILFTGCNNDYEKYLQKAEVLLKEGKPKKAIRYLQKYIENDSSKPYKNPKVRLQLAQLYLEHDPKNNTSIKLLEEAGEQDVYEAYALLSLLYSKGEIVVSDPFKAFNYIQNASSSGDHNYIFTLGKYLFNGYGVSSNTSLASEYFLEAAENGNIEASNYLCEIYKLEKHNMQSSELASKHCQIAVNHELPRAIHANNLYQITVDENSLLALIKNASKRWIPSHLALVKGVMKGNFKKHRKEIFQLFNLGFNGAQNEFYKDINELKAFYYRYWQRYPYEADKELAFKYLNEARKAQQPMAMTDWAIINLDNQNEQAHKLLKLAAQAQEPTANAFLGSLYLSTDSGFTRNEAQALKHLRAACSSKIVTSCYQLGTLLSESYDIPRNLNTAFKHLSYAAFNKYANALEKALNLARLHPSIVVPSTLKKLQKIARQIESTSSNIDAPVKRPWQVLLDRSMKTDDQSEKSKLLDLSRKSLLNEPVEGFELNYNQHQIEHESFKLQISSNPFDTLDQMKSSWELLQISQATKTLKNFFLFDGIKVNWGNNLKRLERLERSLELHYRLQSMRIYEDSYEFWKTNFDAIDEYFSSLISYKRAHKNLTGLSSDKFETTLRHRRAEIALRLASIDHELGHLEACKQWVAKAKKDNHPIHQLVQGRMLVSAEVNLRNDTLAWQLLIDSAGTSPHIDSQSSLPLPGGKAESLLLLSKMVANRRSPKKYWGKKHEYMFLKAACYFQPRYKHLLTKLGKQIDPRLALQAEKLAYRWIKNGDK